MNFLPRISSSFGTLLQTSVAIHRTTFSTFSRCFEHRGSTFLRPVVKVETLPLVAGLKHVSQPKRRCKSCYKVVQDERVYIFCDKYPRHKQVSIRYAYMEKYARIMTHATQGGYRNGHGRFGMLTQDHLRTDY